MWEFHAKGLLARFRSTCGRYVENPWLGQLIDDLKMQSILCGKLWITPTSPYIN